MKRGVKGSSCIYTVVKNKTFEEIKITTDINMSPFISNKILKDRGDVGELKKSQVNNSVLFSKNRYIVIGINTISVDNKVNPVFTGFHII